MDQKQAGQFIQSDMFNNAGGLNLTDSPIRVADEQATGGYNYEYGLTGGFKKRLGHEKLNGTAYTATQHLGVGLLFATNNTKTVIRKADRKMQSLNTSTFGVINLTEDTTAVNSDFTPAAQKMPSVFSSFTTAVNTVLWTAGSNATAIYGAYSASKATKNGSDAPTGGVTPTVGGSGGQFVGTGIYTYAFVFRKTSTQAESNAALDVSATVASVTQKVTLTFAFTNLDTAKYDKIEIYRSPVSGLPGFTAGDLVAIIPSTDTSYVDDGTYAATSQNIPRAGNIVLDNSVLPSGTFNALTVFKRRLVTAIGSTIYLSDLNKPESWPLTNVITVPSGGPITGLSIISFSTPTSANGVDEFLAIFKENELWVITGDDYTTYSLLKIDNVGSMNQANIVLANGYLSWFDRRGVYLWDGSGKPIYASRPIEFQFGPDGSYDKAKFNLAWGTFHKRTNQIVWYISDTVLGEQQAAIKMDLRLTLPNIESSLQGRIIEGIFIQDTSPFPLYGGISFYPDNSNATESFYSGDSSGYIYNLYSGVGDSAGGINFSYQTKILDFGIPTQVKRIHKVIVWVEDSTDADLTLDFWTGYNISDSDKSSLMQPISRRVTRALWDAAYWDAADWDSNMRTYSPVVFNIYSPKGGEGDSFTIKLSQNEANAPVSIAGISIFYTILGLRK